MRKIKITNKNLNYVFGLLNKFFKKDRSYRYWHNFDCGFKKRIKFYKCEDGFIVMPNITINASIDIRDSYILIYLRNFYNFDFDFDNEAFTLCEGDEILFCGNRITVKKEWETTSHHYCYQTIEILPKIK